MLQGWRLFKMHRSYPPSPRLSTRSNDESSIEDYDDALLDIDDGEMEYTHEHTVQNFETLLSTMNNEQSRPSSVTTAEWEEPESWLASAQNSESCPVSTPGSSSGASPLTGTSSQGISPGINHNYEQAFPFSIPQDAEQSLSCISDVLQVEKDFMEYVMSFPLSVSNVPRQLLPVPSTTSTKKLQAESNPKVGLDHLDNLCKLMEQLSDLKEANIKLKRRVQYLEDIKTLHEIHKEMVGERKLYSSGLSEDEVQQLKHKLDDSVDRELSEDSQPESMHLETQALERVHGLYRSKTANQIPTNDFKSGHKSRSIVINKERRERSKSVGHPGHPKAPKKRPSRWSKVKEVLGIEKTEEFSTGGEGEKSDETDKIEISKDKESLSRKGSDKSKSSIASSKHLNVLSSRSFSEAERQSNTVIVTGKKSGTLDSKNAQAMMERFEKEETGPKKSPKSPWGKMKTMIQIRRDNRQQKSESSSSSPRDAKSSSKPSIVQSADRRSQRTNYRSPFQDVENGSQPSEYDRNLSNGQYSDRSPRLHRMGNGLSDQNRHRQKSPQKPGYRKNSNSFQGVEDNEKEENHRNKLDERDNYCGEKNATKENGKRKKSKPRPIPLNYVEDDQALPCEEPETGASPLTQKKWMWSKMKGVLKGKREEDCPLSLSVPSSPSSVAECLSFDFDLEKSKEEDNSIYATPRGSECPPCAPGIIPSSSPSITVTELLRELQQNLSDDFNKKLEEWQRCRAEGIHKIPSPQVERKDSFGRMRKISKPEKKISAVEKIGKSNYHLQKKDLSWLEKEQQKIDREIIRLTKEKQKFEKRAFRLKQLKETMTDNDGQKKEVLVKTSAGEFRFEGISDDFTKKLYEWETKKGVNPELSTIALLDESLKVPADVSTTAPCSNSVGSSSTRPSPEPSKNCYQVSRASSEPDLSFTLKESNSNNQATRSKSGDTLLAGEAEIGASLDVPNPSTPQQNSRDNILHGDDNYYSLLEENMYLLDQLKEKEEICSHLQNELDRLDDKTEKTNRTHQEEMEKYRQKLWEIHMSRPRDLQGSLRLISELKSRIEELQKCSDKLKSDRERLEESFRYHSSQQARLADDLIRRVRELQESGVPWGISRGCRRKWRKLIKCDHNSISKIHELSTRLLQQARDVEQTLMERTRQVCHLRWELLHRDMSAVLLQAALHRVTSQGEPVTILPTWDKRRNKFKNIKAWSVDTTTRRPSEDLVTDDWLQERLHQLSMTPYNEWANIDFSPNDLMVTAHELKKETLRLAISRPDRVSDSEEKKSATCSAESEIADSDRYYDTGSAVNSRSSSFSSGPGGLRGSHSDTRLYERTRALRRNSSSSMSCVEASDSSSMHDSDKVHTLIKKFPWRTQWRSLDNVSSSCSSGSSVLEDDMIKLQWKSTKPPYKHVISSDETSHNQLQVKYGTFKEVDEETEELKTDPSDWGSHCLITPRPIHLARISDTESDKNTHSPPPYHKTDTGYGISVTKSLKSVPSGYASSSSTISSYKDMLLSAHIPNSSLSPSYQFQSSKSPTCGEYESYSEQNASYKSATEGSIESLDKYETAIRDEELTISDESNLKDNFNYMRDCEMETFSEFEEDLKQRVTKNVPSPSNISSPSQSSDYSGKNKQPVHTVCNVVFEQSSASAPGAPNFMKFKYKGTRGFGHSPRMEYNKIEESSAPAFMHSQMPSNNHDTTDDSFGLGS